MVQLVLSLPGSSDHCGLSLSRTFKAVCRGGGKDVQNYEYVRQYASFLERNQNEYGQAITAMLWPTIASRKTGWSIWKNLPKTDVFLFSHTNSKFPMMQLFSLLVEKLSTLLLHHLQCGYCIAIAIIFTLQRDILCNNVIKIQISEAFSGVQGLLFTF